MDTVSSRALDYSQTILPAMIPREAELTVGLTIEAGQEYGFFTDSTLCIGCKACEVACKEWNALPADNRKMTGFSYDNTGSLSATTWRHVNFIEQIAPVDQSIQPDVSRVGPLQLDPPSLPGFLPDLALLRASDQDGERSALQRPAIENRWLMHSDVCKHCANAGCVQACPTGALFHTEFGTVVVQQDICNGCGYCIPSCPFGVVALNLDDGRAHKCTLCYDRLKGGLEPACAKSCPTDSIEFGPVSQLREKAERRVSHLHQRGVNNAYLYGTPGSHGTSGGIERLNSISLLLDRPETYNLPAAPTLPSTRIKPGFIAGLLTMAAVALSALAAFDDRRSNSQR